MAETEANTGNITETDIIDKRNDCVREKAKPQAKRIRFTSRKGEGMMAYVFAKTTKTIRRDKALMTLNVDQLTVTDIRLLSECVPNFEAEVFRHMIDQASATG